MTWLTGDTTETAVPEPEVEPLGVGDFTTGAGASVLSTAGTSALGVCTVCEGSGVGDAAGLAVLPCGCGLATGAGIEGMALDADAGNSLTTMFDSTTRADGAVSAQAVSATQDTASEPTTVHTRALPDFSTVPVLSILSTEPTARDHPYYAQAT